MRAELLRAALRSRVVLICKTSHRKFFWSEESRCWKNALQALLMYKQPGRKVCGTSLILEVALSMVRESDSA